MPFFFIDTNHPGTIYYGSDHDVEEFIKGGCAPLKVECPREHLWNTDDSGSFPSRYNDQTSDDGPDYDGLDEADVADVTRLSACTQCLVDGHQCTWKREHKLKMTVEVEGENLGALIDALHQMAQYDLDEYCEHDFVKHPINSGTISHRTDPFSFKCGFSIRSND